MKNIRVKYIKDGKAKYISHLDMNRCMTRCLQGARIPLWHTEGFNPHLFITFALPLSLGYTGLAEYMDMRLIEDMPYDEIINRMNSHLPGGIRVVDVYDRVTDPKEISSALFKLEFPGEENDIPALREALNKLISKDSIIVQKKSKSGIKDVDIKPYIEKFSTKDTENGFEAELILPAGNTVNINPSLILTACEKEYGNEIFCRVTRAELFCKDGSVFR